jgi:hypothetical protein
VFVSYGQCLIIEVDFGHHIRICGCLLILGRVDLIIGWGAQQYL